MASETFKAMLEDLQDKDQDQDPQGLVESLSVRMGVTSLFAACEHRSTSSFGVAIKIMQRIIGHDVRGFEGKRVVTPSMNVCPGDPVTLGSSAEECRQCPWLRNHTAHWIRHICKLC